MEQSRPFSEDGSSNVGKSQNLTNNSYLEEVDRQLVYEFKTKSKAEKDAALQAADQKAQQDQFERSKLIYNSMVKARRNEKSLKKAAMSSKINATVIANTMTAKANFIPELQDLEIVQENPETSQDKADKTK